MPCHLPPNKHVHECNTAVQLYSCTAVPVPHEGNSRLTLVRHSRFIARVLEPRVAYVGHLRLELLAVRGSPFWAICW